MKLQDLLRHIADNVESGKDQLDGLISPTLANYRDVFTNSDAFSLAPRTHEVNGFTVPAPETEMPEKNKDYYFCVLNSKRWYEYSYWTDSKDDLILLARRLVYLNEDAAIANAKAMLGIDPYSDGEK